MGKGQGGSMVGKEQGRRGKDQWNSALLDPEYPCSADTDFLDSLERSRVSAKSSSSVAGLLRLLGRMRQKSSPLK